MMVSEKLESLIVATAFHFFGKQKSDSWRNEGLKPVEKFLTAKTCRILCAYLENIESDGDLKFSNTLQNVEHSVVYTKVICRLILLKQYKGHKFFLYETFRPIRPAPVIYLNEQ